MCKTFVDLYGNMLDLSRTNETWARKLVEYEQTYRKLLALNHECQQLQNWVTEFEERLLKEFNESNKSVP
jgi:hypothetical protein